MIARRVSGTALPPRQRARRHVGGLLALAALIAAAGVVSGCGGGGASQKALTATQTTPTAPRPPTTASTPSFPQLVARVQSGVVRIEVRTCDGEAVGTGFLVGRRLVATVEHVVDGATTITIKRRGKVLGSGRVVGEDSARDLALVRASAPIRGHVFQLARRAPQLGEAVAAFGFPLGLPLTVTRGSVSGLDRAIPIGGLTRHRLVQTDAAVNPGNSGGPLLSTDSGDVVGLVDLGTTQANGLAFAVSAQVAEPLLRAWALEPQAVAATTCSPAPQPAPATSPSPASDQTAVADAVYGYWDAIQQGDYATAFSYLSSSEQRQLGGERSFASTHAADPLRSVDVVVNVTSLGGRGATADVVRLRTLAPSTGCRDWTGTYDLVYEGGQWLINRANLNFTAC